MPPSPAPPWQLEQFAVNTSAPAPIGPSTVASDGVSERAYMNTHNGMMLSVAIAQNGIFLRRFAAAMYGGSGLTGGAAGAAFAGPAAFAAAAGAAGEAASTAADG